ncbi:MAG: MBL fold metallo-hydrolase [Capsulimonas sp.]|uniref:MBL fold metallo-hydrolase n=1 Tax=Capsulimonas sp. TaxID=2494211 RepID=UPI0032645325
MKLVHCSILLLVVATGCGKSTSGAFSSKGILTPPAPAGAPMMTGKNVLTVSYIDIGQGDSELLQTPSGKNILIDSGPPEGRKALLGYLAKRGVTDIDFIVASHPHEDHIGNMVQVLQTVKVHEFVDSGLATASQTQKRMLQEIKSHSVKFTIVSRSLVGTKRDLGDGITMEFFAPKAPLLTGTDSDPNNNSVVCKVTDGKVRFLFCGDEEEKERARLYEDNPDLKSDIYKTAHHGSHNGTDDDFMARVQPKDAIISCGVNNSYGHPHKEAMAALAKAGARVWRTDKQGTIVVTTDGDTYHVTPLGKSADAPAPGKGQTRGRHKDSSSMAPAPAAAQSSPSTDVVNTGNGPIVGNTRSHIYHVVKDGGTLPSPKNRVYFNSAAEAEAAGYRAARN